MKILILGAQGMLGYDLAKEFCDYNPVLWDLPDLDIANEEEVRKKLTGLKPDFVINAAAFTDVEGAEKKKELALEINGYAVGYLGQVCESLEAIFIHFSTEYVFDGENKEGYDEVAQSNPINAYGESKALGEKLLADYNQSHYLIRSSWMYGKAPQVGKPRGLNFIEIILEKAKTQKEVEVVNDQFGRPTYTLDVASGVREILEKELPFGIYHLVNETPKGGISWCQLAKKALAIKKIKTKVVPIPSNRYPSKVQRPQYAALLNTKFRKLRGWEEALRDYLA